jgi:hypothetical protein
MYAKGRATEVKLDTAALETARAFIAEMEKRWDARLETLRAFAERESQ